MPGTLYLDTARLGRMSPSARNANLDFVRLSAEEPSSLYFENFLRDGKDAWPLHYRQRYPGLNCWQGISELKQSLACTVGSPPDRRLLLANRSAQFTKLAARLLFRLCRNVMTTDMAWPSYRVLLEAEAARTANKVTTLPLRQHVLRESITSDQLVELFTAEYTRQHCDGLFLPAVDNLGVRLPVEEIVSRIEHRNEIRFVAVDGAQAIRHVPRCFHPHRFDLFIAGCHKWLRAYHPMGVAVCGRERSREFIDQTIAAMIDSFEIDDPLLRFTEQLESGRLDAYSETVNITPLFSCRGALEDALQSDLTLTASLRIRSKNADLVCDASVDSGWHPVRPNAEFQTGVLLLQPDRFDTYLVSVDRLRAAFHGYGIVLTAYEEGLVRMSMPDRPFEATEVNQIRHALSRVYLDLRCDVPTASVA